MQAEVSMPLNCCVRACDGSRGRARILKLAVAGWSARHLAASGGTRSLPHLVPPAPEAIVRSARELVLPSRDLRRAGRPATRPGRARRGALRTLPAERCPSSLPTARRRVGRMRPTASTAIWSGDRLAAGTVARTRSTAKDFGRSESGFTLWRGRCS